VRARLQGEVRDLREDMIRLMSTALEAGNALAEGGEQYVISGERNLFAIRDLSQDVGRLKQLVELLERKTSLLQILDLSLRGQGVQIFIGGESNVSAPDDVSVVTSPYKVDGEVVGTVGVIGPTRMAYDRVVPIVDITAKLLSSALSSSRCRVFSGCRSSTASSCAPVPRSRRRSTGWSGPTKAHRSRCTPHGRRGCWPPGPAGRSSMRCATASPRSPRY
jgi:hypothetical protein